MCPRDAALLDRASTEVAALALDGPHLDQFADVSRDQGEQMATAALNAFPPLHILVKNAGVFGPLGPVDDIDWDAWDKRPIVWVLVGDGEMRGQLDQLAKLHDLGEVVRLLPFQP